MRNEANSANLKLWLLVLKKINMQILIDIKNRIKHRYSLKYWYLPSFLHLSDAFRTKVQRICTVTLVLLCALSCVLLLSNIFKSFTMIGLERFPTKFNCAPRQNATVGRPSLLLWYYKISKLTTAKLNVFPCRVLP